MVALVSSNTSFGPKFIASVSIFHPRYIFGNCPCSMKLYLKIASDVTAPLRMTRGIERTFSRPFSETFRISKNEDFNGPCLENENEFLKNSFETVFRASKSCDRDQLVSAFQLTFNWKPWFTGNLITVLRIFSPEPFRVPLSDIMFSFSVCVTQCVQQSSV